MGRGRINGRSWREIVQQSHDAAARARDVAAEARGGEHHGTDALRDLVERVRHDPESITLPSADSFTTGPQTIPAGAQHSGTVATANGNVDVFGTVTGDAIAIDGTVELHPGAHVTGSAFAAGGEVRLDSGATVDGEIRSLTGDFGPVSPTLARTIGGTSSRWHDVRLALMGYALLLMLSIGVLTFAEEQLDHVTVTLADHFGRSVGYGLVGELAFGPGLAVMVLALTITIVGILAVPFATVGYCAIGVGAATLGFIAVAEATGTAVLRSREQASLTPRGAQLRAIVTGVSMYSGLWVLTAIVGSESGVGIAVRVVAVVVTAVAITVGFGAVLVWRFELRRARRVVGAAPGTPLDDAVWQTPTPVAGVAAARRPTPVAHTSEKSS
jgi:hypothetical protein